MSFKNTFSLMEIMVIVVTLGIVGAIAIPQFASMAHSGSQQAVDLVAARLNSASAVNYAACRTGSGECRPVNRCDDFSSRQLYPGGLSGDYTIKSRPLGNNSGDTITCRLKHNPTGLTANFTGITP